MLNPEVRANTATQDLIAIEATLGAHNYKPLDVVLVRGQGVWVWDNDGKRYLDCLSAYSAAEPGPLPPEDPGGDGRAGAEADAHLARIPQRPARAPLRGPREAHAARTRSCR